MTPFFCAMTIYLFHSATAATEGYAVSTLPDTALLVGNKPFFIPDFAEHCMARLCVALKITRLGKSIDRRFAHRYYNQSECTVAYHFTAQPLLDNLKAESAPWDLAIGFDSAVVLGTQPLTPLMTGTLESLLPTCDTLIEHISSHFQLRQGDLLLIPHPEEVPSEVHIGDHLFYTHQGETLLSFNIK